MFALNNDVAFQPSATTSGRVFVTARYSYETIRIGRQTNLPIDIQWLTRLEAQWSDDNLLSSEQFGLGGGANVRGYEDRVVNADRGLFLSNEIRSPEFSPLQALGIPIEDDHMRVLAFWDYGVAALARPDVGERRAYDMSGVGVGFRYRSGSIVVIADWGKAMVQVLPTDNSRFHLSVATTF